MCWGRLDGTETSIFLVFLFLWKEVQILENVFQLTTLKFNMVIKFQVMMAQKLDHYGDLGVGLH